MGSKIFLVLGLLVAIVFMSPDVAARDLAETSIDHKKNAEKATERNGVSGGKNATYGYPPGGVTGATRDPHHTGVYGDTPRGHPYTHPRGGGVYGRRYPPVGRYCPNGC